MHSMEVDGLGMSTCDLCVKLQMTWFATCAATNAHCAVWRVYQLLKAAEGTL